ncbi:hypothetical protein C8Q80DRAFT_1190494 [Daedaleopsis nitida]|nr:hypothetical protein C8Q80DRAFT_1190494 [Daedaleopsis nitida]
MSSANTQSAQPKVVIIGGDLQGLYLLLTLHRRGFSATLYEPNTNPDNLPSKATAKDCPATEGDVQDKVTSPDDTASNANDNSATPPGAASDDKVDSGSNDPNDDEGVPRQGYSGQYFDYAAHMRKKLLRACPADSIMWEHVLSSVHTLEDGQHELAFTNGVTGLCDILLNADGKESRILAAISPTTPVYSSSNGVETLFTPTVAGSLDLTDIFHAVDYSGFFSFPELAESAPRGPFPHTGRGGPFGRHGPAPEQRGVPRRGSFGGGRGGCARGGRGGPFDRHAPYGHMHGHHGAPPPFPPPFGIRGLWSAGPDMRPPSLPSFRDFESFGFGGFAGNHGMPPFPPPSFGFFEWASSNDHPAFPPPFGPHAGYGQGTAPFPPPRFGAPGQGPFGLNRAPNHPMRGGSACAPPMRPDFSAPFGLDAETGSKEEAHKA